MSNKNGRTGKGAKKNSVSIASFFRPKTSTSGNSDLSSTSASFLSANSSPNSNQTTPTPLTPSLTTSDENTTRLLTPHSSQGNFDSYPFVCIGTLLSFCIRYIKFHDLFCYHRHLAFIPFATSRAVSLNFLINIIKVKISYVDLDELVL